MSNEYNYLNTGNSDQDDAAPYSNVPSPGNSYNPSYKFMR